MLEHTTYLSVVIKRILHIVIPSLNGEVDHQVNLPQTLWTSVRRSHKAACWWQLTVSLSLGFPTWLVLALTISVNSFSLLIQSHFWLICGSGGHSCKGPVVRADVMSNIRAQEGSRRSCFLSCSAAPRSSSIAEMVLLRGHQPDP